jgi:FkbM family methyltransferase
MSRSYIIGIIERTLILTDRKNAMLPPMRIYTTRNDIKYLLVEHDEVISDHIKRDGVWGKNYLDTCAKILSNVPAGRVIDVGASIGTWTVPLALMFEGKHEFDAIEPLPKVNMQLNANVLLNNLENVNVHRVAISDVTETKHAPALDFAISAKTDREDVYEFRRLDDFRFGNVRLIKVTTPAFETKVFMGMFETLQLSNWPPVLFESWTADWYTAERAKALDFFAARGYEHYLHIDDHVIAFKTKSQADQLLDETTNVVKKAESSSPFSVAEYQHDVKTVLDNQVAAKFL